MMTIDLIYLVLGALGAGGIGVAGPVAAARASERARDLITGQGRGGPGWWIFR